MKFLSLFCSTAIALDIASSIKNTLLGNKEESKDDSMFLRMFKEGNCPTIEPKDFDL